MAPEKANIDCFSCIHFYITWDQRHPKGCKAMGFKSREMPSMVVQKSSGMDCLHYIPKDPRNTRK